MGELIFEFLPIKVFAITRKQSPLSVLGSLSVFFLHFFRNNMLGAALISSVSVQLTVRLGEILQLSNNFDASVH
jgi:hypothetical protein